jgi:hypothetical protein
MYTEEVGWEVRVILKFPRMAKLVSMVATVTIVGAACAGGGASGGSQSSDSPSAGSAPSATSTPSSPTLTLGDASSSLPSLSGSTSKAVPAPDLIEIEGNDDELDRARFSTRGWSTDFSKRTIPLSDILSGGPGKDGIPAIDDPQFESIADGDLWLVGSEPVHVVAINGEVKAYPLGILIWHEIVNDTVGGVPVVVTYCPLCNSALTFDRRLGHRLLDFGVSGNLRFSDMIMYDRQTETWWQQLEGVGIIGDLVNEQLPVLPSPVVSWEQFKTAHPDATVLSRDTGYNRRYGNNPYSLYDTGSPFLFTGSTDARLKALDRVVAIDEGGETVAFPFIVLQQEKVVPYTLGGKDLVVFFQAGTNSALDASNIAVGRDVGATNVFRLLIGEQQLTFEASDTGFIDNETDTTWNLLGQGLTGPLAGEQLEAVAHGNHFWFAWGVFKPDTVVYTGAVG